MGQKTVLLCHLYLPAGGGLPAHALGHGSLPYVKESHCLVTAGIKPGPLGILLDYDLEGGVGRWSVDPLSQQPGQLPLLWTQNKSLTNSFGASGGATCDVLYAQ